MKKLILLFLFFGVTTTAFADEYYIGQWVWNDADSSDVYWEAPVKDKLTGAIDLRGPSKSGQPGPTPQGYALFAYSETVSHPNLTHLGGNLDESPNSKAKGVIAGKLGITPQKDTIREIIYELLTVHADPTGNLRWKPLMPDDKLNMKIKLGREVIKESKLIPGVSPEWPMVLANIQESYKDWLSWYPYRKIAMGLDFLEEKYDVPYQTFIPNGYTQIASLPHETPLTDDFNCSSSDNLDCDLGWTEPNGDLDIISDTIVSLVSTSGSGTAIATVDTSLSTDDHYAQIQIVALDNTGSLTAAGQVMARYTDISNYYLTTTADAGPPETFRLRKLVAGTATTLGTDDTYTWDNNDFIEVEANGSTIRSLLNDVEMESQTDTDHSGQLVVGIGGIKSTSGRTVRYDNFEADIVAAGVAAGPIGIMFKGLHIKGVSVE